MTAPLMHPCLHFGNSTEIRLKLYIRVRAGRPKKDRLSFNSVVFLSCVYDYSGDLNVQVQSFAPQKRGQTEEPRRITRINID